tara:strand:- start:2123 stop:2725 length:603 start_codon:yes stop_codon:yes gene_type:complete
MDTIAVSETTVRSLQIIFAYQGKQLIRKIGKKMNWDDKEINNLIKEFINTNELRIELVTNGKKTRGRRSVELEASERCIALTASGEQCSRKRKDDHYCGIHLRKSKSEDGLQFGVVEDKLKHNDNKTKVICKKNNHSKNSNFYSLGNVVSDSSSEDEISVATISINNNRYLIDYTTNYLYDYSTEKYVGKYNKEQNTIVT